jgi:hypothetical protein
MKTTIKNKTNESNLNNRYSDIFTEDETVERLIYLTNKSRGQHTTENAIRKAYRDNKVATLLKKYDPIAYNAECSEFN